ncbi:MAG: hypothetical protein GEV12_13010 [Micromonosporaceae bacterium]|nr:hypothetical protein [Micromonosporaceae bacterium]
MDRRRLLLVVAAVGAGAVLVVLARPGGSQDGAPDQARAPAGAPSWAPAPASPAPAIEDGSVTGAEALDPAELPEALRAAERFAARWSTPDPDWPDRVTELATPALAAELAGTDPPRPAREIVGPGQLYLDAPRWARIGVPADGGTVVLDVVAVDGGWLVSAVDWWPA